MGTLRATRLLLGVELRRLGRWNEFCHSRDRQFRRSWLAMAAVGAMLILLFAFYATAASVGMQWLGLGALSPGCLYAAAALTLAVFEISRAGTMLFSDAFCQQAAPLPVPRAALLLSRFLAVYLPDLLVCTLLIGPSICLFVVGNGLAALPAALLGLLTLPLLPLAVAALLGAAITTGTARLRHGKLIGNLLLLFFTLVMLALCFGASASLPAEEANLLALVEPALQRVVKTYPPAFWWSRALNGEASWLLPLVAVSFLSVGLLLLLAAPHYPSLCAALHAGGGKRTAAAIPRHAERPIAALFWREWRRYLGCGIYLTNTAVGYLLLVLLAAGYRLGGAQAFAALGLPDDGAAFLPLVFGFLLCLAPPSACAVSLDGPQWDLLRSLPIQTANFINSKLLLNLAVGGPCWVAASLFMLGTPGAEWNIAVSGLYLVFGAVLGLAVNLHLPLLHWDNETQVVKQSAAVLVTMLGGTVAAGLPAAALALFPAGIVYPALCALLPALTAALYLHSRRFAWQRLAV